MGTPMSLTFNLRTNYKFDSTQSCTVPSVQASDLIKQMEVEVRSMEKDERKLYGEKITAFKKELADQKSNFNAAKNLYEREGLLGTGGVPSQKSLEQRQQMLDTQEKFTNQNEKILNMQKLVAETEEVGSEIIGELERNREKIQSAQDKVNTVNADMDTAKTTVKRMNDREKRCVIC